MKRIIALGIVLLLSFSSFAVAGECYWVCSNGELVPIRNGVCVMPVKPVKVCRHNPASVLRASPPPSRGKNSPNRCAQRCQYHG